MPVTDIPDDIWSYIAEMLPLNTLRDMLTVNRVFFEMAMNARYREVSFLHIDSNTIRLLQRLKYVEMFLKFELNSPIHDRDPNVAKRVRHLRVNPMWFKPPESVSFAGGRVRRWYSEFRFFGGSASKFRILDTERPVIQAMTIDLVGSFRNVTRYTIVTRYHPNPANLIPFLAIAWKSFGSNLRRLTLNAPLGGFETLIATSGDLDALEDLNLRFSTDVATEDTAEDMATMLRLVVPFINSLSSTLRSLTILSSAFQDHTAFFHSLGHFPKLLSFALYIAFNPPLISDPSGLTRFLNDHAETLQHVTLQPHISFRSFPSSESANNTSVHG